MARHADKRRSPLWLDQVRGQAHDVKDEEERASRKRWEALQETDRRRLEAEARDDLAQQTKDRRTLQWGLGIAAAIVLIVLAVSILSLLR